MSNANLGTGTFVLNFVNNAGRGITSFANDMGGLTKVVAQNWWGVRALADAFAVLPLAVGAGVALSVKAASEWESAMVDVRRTTTGFGAESAGEWKQVEDGLKGLANSTPIAIGELGRIAAAAGALGVKSGDVVKFTDTVINLSQTTDLSADVAATSLARIAALTGLSADQYDNLASSILKTGQETAATEGEIVNIATRLAGVAGVVGLSADEVIGFSAAMASAGIKSEAAGTAMQKTLLQIQRAVQENGDDLTGWANIAGGMVPDAFAKMFRDDPAAAFTKVIQGLSGMAGGTAMAAARLRDLGVTSERQVRTMLALVVAEQQTGNENLKLSNILKKSREGMLQSELAADLAQKKFDTFSGQIAILRNQLTMLGAAFGAHILPWIKPVIGFFQNMIFALGLLPGPVKMIIVGLIGFAAAVSGVLAIFGLLVPRILLGVDAVSKLFAAFTGSAAGIGAQTGALNANTAAATRNAAAQTAAATAAGEAGATKAVGAGVGAVADVAPAAGAVVSNGSKVGGALAGLGGKAAGFAKSFGLITVALLVVATAFNWFGNKVKAQKKAIDDSYKTNKDLVALLGQEKGALGENVDAWLLRQDAMQKAIAVGAELGIGTQKLLDVIKGTASDADMADFKKKMSEGAKKGVPGFKEAADALARLHNSFQTSRSDAASVIRSNGQITGSSEAVSAAIDEESAANEKASQSRLDYIQAGRSLLKAQDDVKSALKDYNDALKDAADKAEKVASANAKLESAQRGVESATKALEAAQKDLTHAREDGLNALADSEDSLASARDKQFDINDQITKQEQDLADLRMGPSADAMRDATNKLAAAQLNLVKSTRQVKDAEWKLQYLREEGASGRDIELAEQNVADAKQNVADATDAQIDAQKELDDLTDPVARAKAIDKAERDLAATRREAQTNLREIAKDEKEVADLRDKVANDTFYRDAQDKVTEAQQGVRDATREVIDAEKELAKARAGTDTAKAVEDASKRVEDALYSEAEAMVETQKTQFEANNPGQKWSPMQQAKAMADALDKVAKEAPTKKIEKDLKDLGGMYRNAFKEAEKAANATAGLTKNIIDDQTDHWWDKWVEPPKQGWRAKLEESIPGGKAGMGAIIGGLIGAVLGTFVFPGIGTALGAGIGVVVGGLVGAIMDKFPAIGEAVSTGFEGAWEGIKTFGKGIAKWLDEALIHPFKEAWGVHSPSTVMFDIGVDVVTGFINGILSAPGRLISWGGETLGHILEGIGNAGTWLWDTGQKVLVGLTEGMGSLPGNIASAAGGLATDVINAFWDAGTWLWSAGTQIMQGLLDGIQWGWQNIFKSGWNWIIDAIPGSFANGIKIESPSKVFHGFGENIIQGLANGISDISSVQKAMGTLASSVKNTDLNPYALDALRPTSASSDSATSAALAGQVVNNYNFNLETHTGASAPELMNEFMWNARVRLR
jgi:TP901 family phage tail tape measure protein